MICFPHDPAGAVKRSPYWPVKAPMWGPTCDVQAALIMSSAEHLRSDTPMLEHQFEYGKISIE
jgi:hypothetical protein